MLGVSAHVLGVSERAKRRGRGGGTALHKKIRPFSSKASKEEEEESSSNSSSSSSSSSLEREWEIFFLPGTRTERYGVH